MTERLKNTGLMNRTLIHTAARLHYIDGLPQVEVARRMEMSTASVSRLLTRAREEGIVRFEVPPLEELANEHDAVARALGLKQIRAIETGHPPALSVAVGKLIQEANLDANPVVAIGWGRAMQSVVTHGLPALANATVVPATGGMNQTQSHFQINEFARTTAEQMGGQAKLLFAPARPSPELYTQLVRTPEIAEVMALWERVDVTVTGVGNYVDASTSHGPGFLPEQASRVVGDVVRQYFDIDGTPIEWPNQSYQMGMSRQQLRRVPLAIGVCVGADKVDPIIGAARAGLINTLVTDARTIALVEAKLGVSEAE